MITLQKIMTELKAESLNEIVAGKHGSTHGKTSGRTTKKSNKTSTKKKYY